MLEDIILLITRHVLFDLGGTAERGEVLDAVVAEGDDADQFRDLSRDDVEDLLSGLTTDGSSVVAVGDELVELTVVAEGAVFTHRLTEEERAGSLLDLDADLPVLGRMAFADGGLHLADGARLDLRSHQREGEGRAGTPLQTHQLVGPEGWLDDWVSGTMLALSATSGILSIDDVTEPDGAEESGSASPPAEDRTAKVATAIGDRLWAAYERANGGDGSPVFPEELQAAWLLEGWAGLDESTPPFGAILQAAGFELNGAMVGPPDSWEGHAQLGRLIGRIMRHGNHLDEDESEAMTGLLGAFEAWLADSSVAPDAVLVDRLTRYPGAAVCLEEELIRIDPTGEHIEGFLATIGATGSRPRVAALVGTLRALAADLRGDGPEVEAHIEAARLADPDWYPAIDWRVRFHEVRGQAQEAVNLLQRYRTPEDEELVAMRNRVRQAWTAVGRNEPCPCGSGRKFKQCHQGGDLLPPEARVNWLLDKVRAHVMALEASLIDDLPTSGDAPEAAFLSAVDVAMFDLGGAADFLRARRSLLPPEEVALLEAWVTGNRPSVYRVTGVTETEVAVTDQADGQQMVVHPTLAWADVAPYDLVWSRLLPGGDRWWSGGMVRSTRLVERAGLLAAVQGEPEELHRRLMGITDGPGPRQFAADGEPLVEGLAVWTVPGRREQVAEVLDSFGERSEEGDAWTATPVEGVTAQLTLDEFNPLFGSAADTSDALGSDSENPGTDVGIGRVDGADDGTNAVLGAGDVDGPSDEPGDDDRWQVWARTTSVAGHRATIERVEDRFPGAERVVDHATPVARIEAVAHDDELLAGLFDDDELDGDEWDGDEDIDGIGEAVADAPGADEADASEAMADIIARLEEHWLDQPIGVLGDVTPRQASADPDRVDDLRTLMREMERHQSLVSVDRLCDRLGLDRADRADLTSGPA